MNTEALRTTVPRSEEYLRAACVNPLKSQVKASEAKKRRGTTATEGLSTDCRHVCEQTRNMAVTDAAALG